MPEPTLAGVAELAREGGRMLLDLRAHDDLRIEERDSGPRCRADLAVEEFLCEAILGRHPDHAILAEESADGSLPPAGRPLWVIDPLDGTTNYVQGHPTFCVSIAYGQSAGETFEPELAAIVHPPSGECFLAQRGAGATLDGEPLSVGGDLSVGQRSLALSLSGADPGELMVVMAALARFRGPRISGAAALDLAFVACARVGGFLGFAAQPWDVAAGALLVREAGGRCAPVSLRSSRLLAGAPDAHGALLEALGA
jgi:myo-inositol-1(or 4)-monophosphatase